ncbi:MAG TPA: N-acetyltransferase, partial [Lachnospiraceae bacterium]|nr:N-acetyltransferase [Lachnospiraceae bacterium]
MLSHFPISGQHEDKFLILTPVAVEYQHLRQGIGKA